MAQNRIRNGNYKIEEKGQSAAYQSRGNPSNLGRMDPLQKWWK